MNPDLYQELVKQINSLQKQVDALVKPENGRWITWTPTVDQGGAVARTINYARYCVKDNIVTVIAKITMTGAGAGGNAIIIAGIPTATQPTNFGAEAVIGIGHILDASATRYNGPLIANTATNWIIHGYNTGFSNGIGHLPNFALAASDVVSFMAVYERT